MPYSDGPQLVSYPVAYSMLEYMLRAKALGAFEGPIGDMTINPFLVPIVKALHEVLAGGQVKLEVTHRGNPDLVRELDQMLAQGGKDANEINKKSGYYVTIEA